MTKPVMWIVGIMFTAISSLLAWGGNTISQKAENNADSIRIIEQKQQKVQLEQAKSVLQLSAIAKAVQAPVVVDTTFADSIVAADISKDST